MCKKVSKLKSCLYAGVAVLASLSLFWTGDISTSCDSKDTTPPVITGVKDITVEVGGNASYRKGVTVTDDKDSAPTLAIDSSKVNLNKVGVYPVLYVATDASGNSSAVTINVYVTEKAKSWTEDSMKQVAAKIVAKCCSADMSDYDKAWALYNYMKKNCTYIHASGDMSSIYAGAYEGLCLKKTDCYGYAASYELLLNTAGVENMMVSRVGGTTNHFWTLVKTDDGWYHCDSSPRSLALPYKCFMQTDAQLEAYTKKYTKKFPDHPNYYTFDKTKYPERGTTIIYGK